MESAQHEAEPLKISFSNLQFFLMACLRYLLQSDDAAEPYFHHGDIGFADAQTSLKKIHAAGPEFLHFIFIEATLAFQLSQEPFLHQPA